MLGALRERAFGANWKCSSVLTGWDGVFAIVCIIYDLSRTIVDEFWVGRHVDGFK